MVDCTGLEIRHTVLPYRGFESLPLRQRNDPVFIAENGVYFFLHALLPTVLPPVQIYTLRTKGIAARRAISLPLDRIAWPHRRAHQRIALLPQLHVEGYTYCAVCPWRGYLYLA